MLTCHGCFPAFCVHSTLLFYPPPRQGSICPGIRFLPLAFPRKCWFYNGADKLAITTKVFVQDRVQYLSPFNTTFLVNTVVAASRYEEHLCKYLARYPPTPSQNGVLNVPFNWHISSHFTFIASYVVTWRISTATHRAMFKSGGQY